MDDIILKNHIIFPASGVTFAEQMNNCYDQLFNKCRILKDETQFVVKQTVFINVESEIEYKCAKYDIMSCISSIYKNVPPTTIVAQNPDKNRLAVEFTVLSNASPAEVQFDNNNDSNWVIFQRENMKMVFTTTGLDSSLSNEDIQNQSHIAFSQLEIILKDNNMNFSDIVRQWNYIEEILGNYEQGNHKSQNYQLFNDIRTEYYSRTPFVNGYPAATAIGMDFGGIIIDTIAVKIDIPEAIVPIKSPVQIDAHNYSAFVLAKNKIMCEFNNTTPKFERAKLLKITSNSCIFISGTAAIKGQKTVKKLSAGEQTELTIDNIVKLISAENLKRQGIETSTNGIFESIRVYVKFESDIEIIKEICFQRFPTILKVFLIADVCRPELLVEIECQAWINNNI